MANDGLNSNNNNMSDITLTVKISIKIDGAAILINIYMDGTKKANDVSKQILRIESISESLHRKYSLKYK
jgi:hypothetical protein